MSTYTLLKPLRVWQQHRSVKRKLAEIAAIGQGYKTPQGYQLVI